MSEEARIVHHHHERGHHDHGESDQFSPPPPPPPAIPQYGTFEGIPHSPSPAMGFPQPVPPRGAMDPSNYYAHGYQAVPGFPISLTPNFDRFGVFGLLLGTLIFLTCCS